MPTNKLKFSSEVQSLVFSYAGLPFDVEAVKVSLANELDLLCQKYDVFDSKIAMSVKCGHLDGVVINHD